MKNISAPLLAYLNSARTFIMADLYTFTLIGGTVIRYTNIDIDLTFEGNTFSKFLINRNKIKTSIGVTVDEVTITVNPHPTDTILGHPWATAVRNGALDGAQLLLQRLFMPTWGDTSLGAMIMFSGRVSDVQMSRTEAQISVKSELELFDTEMPRDLYQSGCLNTLYDNGCAVNKAAKAVTGAVTGGTVTQVNSALGQAAGYFALGSIQFTSGANNGQTRSVRAFGGGNFTLFSPLIATPVAGDTFTAWPGCDKLQSTCDSKFTNIVNFRGFPYVPDPETAT